MHIGMATVGEIGVLKKEIAFSGDVLIQHPEFKMNVTNTKKTY